MTWNELRKEVDRRIKNAKLAKSPKLGLLCLAAKIDDIKPSEIYLTINDKDELWIHSGLQKMEGREI